MSLPPPRLPVVFFATGSGSEPVREWLKSLPPAERRMIGEDIKTVQYRWPLGIPLVRHLGDGLWEVRSRLPNRIARTIFAIENGEIVLFHAFIKKTQKLQPKTRSSPCNAEMPTAKMPPIPKKNPHRGSSFDDFLAAEGILEQVEAAALKRAFALAIADEMQKQNVNKSTLARRLQTSRAALDRLLDPANTSVTLATMTRAAKTLGRKVKFELIPA